MFNCLLDTLLTSFIFFILVQEKVTFYFTFFFAIRGGESRTFSTSNVFPMRNDIIMKSIKLDTTALVHLLFTQKQGNKTDYLLEGKLKKYENEIWEFFFRSERQCFKKPKYTFHHMIETDGVSCSILMLRNDLIGKRIPKIKISSNTEQYIDELSDYTDIKKK